MTGQTSAEQIGPGPVVPLPTATKVHHHYETKQMLFTDRKDREATDAAQQQTTDPYLTKEDIEQSQQTEGDGHGEFGINCEAEDDGDEATEQQGQNDNEPGELEQRLNLLTSKRLHLI